MSILKKLIEALMKNELLCKPIGKIFRLVVLKWSLVTKHDDTHSSAFIIKSQ